MKRKLNLILALIFTLSIVMSSCSIFKKQHTWSEVERTAFLEACVEGMKEMPNYNGEKYCECMLEKIEKITKSAIEAQSITETQMQEMAVDCLKGK